MTYRNPTFQSEEGRSLPYVLLSSSSAPMSPQAGTNMTKNKVRIWMQGGVHGNEPAGDQAILALLGKMDADPNWASSILEKVDILMLPRYNPDGVAYFQRYFATSLDPNRDHTKLASKQTADIKHLVMDYAPHVGVDCHEYTATRRYGANQQWLPAQDAQFSAMKNLNIHPRIRALSETLFSNNIAAALEEHDLRWGPYVVANQGSDNITLEETSSDAKVGDSSVALSQAIMFLSETRGIGIADQHWQRRVSTGLIILQTLVQTAADNAQFVYETVEHARSEFIHGREEIVITDTARPTKLDWKFIEEASGTAVDVPVTFMNTTSLKANLTRSRPEAYVFSRAWLDVALKLKVLGVVVEELHGGFEGTVQALNVVSAELSPAKYEGVARTTVTTQAREKSLTLPAGSFWVSSRQKNAALAFSVLEPENIDSFASFNILPVEIGDEYQVYRVLQE